MFGGSPIFLCRVLGAHGELVGFLVWACGVLGMGTGGTGTRWLVLNIRGYRGWGARGEGMYKHTYPKILTSPFWRRLSGLPIVIYQRLKPPKNEHKKAAFIGGFLLRWITFGGYQSASTHTHCRLSVRA